jgi:hypothetical protein
MVFSLSGTTPKIKIRHMINAVALICGLTLAGAPARANPVTWELASVSLIDGGSASGSFVYDAATDTYSSWDIITTFGSTLSGFEYTSLTSTLLSGSGAGGLLVEASGSGLNLSFSPVLGDPPASVGISGYEYEIGTTGAQRIISEGLVIPVLPSPIPSTLPLFLTGLGALGLLAGRKRQKSAALTD